MKMKNQDQSASFFFLLFVKYHHKMVEAHTKHVDDDDTKFIAFLPLDREMKNKQISKWTILIKKKKIICLQSYLDCFKCFL